MKNDLALKGNIDGVELLIFPSNQLPEKSQRKNYLKQNSVLFLIIIVLECLCGLLKVCLEVRLYNLITSQSILLELDQSQQLYQTHYT